MTSKKNEKDYLAEYDAAAEADKYPLVQKWMKQEPLPFFKQLRKERPVLVTPECTLLALFTDIRDALQMPKIFTVDLYKPKMGVTKEDVGYLMAHDDDALHYREKSLMQGFLNRDDIPRVRELVNKAAKKILNQAKGNIEIVNEYCRVVPTVMVQDYFGLDGIDKKELIRWSFWNQYDAFHNQPFDLNSQEKYQHIVDEHNKVTEELEAYIKALMVRKIASVRIGGMFTGIFRFISSFLRKKQSKDDMVKRMLRSSMANEVDFSLIRVGVNAGGLLIGSVETTSQAVSQVIKFFLDRPELLLKAKVAAKKEDTGDFDDMVWEALRFVPISPYMFRQTAEDYTIAKGTDRQTTIPKGTNVLTLTQSAMFDDYSFENPDDFNPNRNWYHHFNFGFASHECLGKYVGMVMIPEMVRQVILRDDVRATAEMDYKEGPFPEDYPLAWN
ncbi:MAG: cytochrome P450 [Cellvibrionaceae bacterium]